MSHRWVLICVSLPNARSCWWITFPLSDTRLPRRENTTSMACSSAWAMRSKRSKQSASSWTASRHFFPDYVTQRYCERNSAGCFSGWKTTSLPLSLPGKRRHTLTRHGLEEYIADCVIALDHRVTEQISTRRLRIVKYRGTSHGTDEYPFLIDREGISVVPHHLSGTCPQSSRPTAFQREFPLWTR